MISAWMARCRALWPMLKTAVLAKPALYFHTRNNKGA